MHPSTAMAITVRQALLHICKIGDPVEKIIADHLGTYLSEQQIKDLWATLANFELEIAEPTSDRDITEARRLLTDRAYQAQEGPEVEG